MAPLRASPFYARFFSNFYHPTSHTNPTPDSDPPLAALQLPTSSSPCFVAFHGEPEPTETPHHAGVTAEGPVFEFNHEFECKVEKIASVPLRNSKKRPTFPDAHVVTGKLNSLIIELNNLKNDMRREVFKLAVSIKETYDHSLVQPGLQHNVGSQLSFDRPGRDSPISSRLSPHFRPDKSFLFMGQPKCRDLLDIRPSMFKDGLFQSDEHFQRWLHIQQVGAANFYLDAPPDLPNGIQVDSTTSAVRTTRPQPEPTTDLSDDAHISGGSGPDRDPTPSANSEEPSRGPSAVSATQPCSHNSSGKLVGRNDDGRQILCIPDFVLRTVDRLGMPNKTLVIVEDKLDADPTGDLIYYMNKHHDTEKIFGIGFRINPRTGRGIEYIILQRDPKGKRDRDHRIRIVRVYAAGDNQETHSGWYKWTHPLLDDIIGMICDEHAVDVAWYSHPPEDSNPCHAQSTISSASSQEVSALLAAPRSPSPSPGIANPSAVAEPVATAVAAAAKARAMCQIQ
ncbi:uncharacterized protein BXZ73DRAFT_80192 [Epithele typhae]|uniref:uncharacterized protein n=1 Tax=Epithele typhae TaxID=378194 RepID=UPI0020073E0B|nr:uncharacterized protein BXZ73DRAFT_80192 [Epithele typhae]KAH9920251.1 hypothetical protein BXZ73DRAFT_80192 [Epithele typhae]